MNVALPPNRRLERPSDPGKPAREEASKPSREPEPAADKRGKRRKKGASKTPGRTRRLLDSRWFQRFQLMTGIIVVISASVMVAWGLRRYLRSSPRFAVRSITIDGNNRRGAHQILKRAGLEEGMNVFTVDEQAAEAAVEADPWIADASVTVELPASVHIQIQEREAHALASISSELYLVDARGEIFKEWAEGDPHDLMVLSGIDSEEVTRDREGVQMRIRRALELVRDLEEAKIAERHPIQEVNVAPDGALTVVVGADALALAFGTPPYRQKIAKADRILGELRYRKVSPAVVFLDNQAHPERVVVRMR